MQNKGCYFGNKCKILQNHCFFYDFFVEFFRFILLTSIKYCVIISTMWKERRTLTVMKLGTKAKNFGAVVSYSNFIFSFNIWFFSWRIFVSFFYGTHVVSTNQTIKKVFWLLFPFRFCVSKWLPWGRQEKR